MKTEIIEIIKTTIIIKEMTIIITADSCLRTHILRPYIYIKFQGRNHAPLQTKFYLFTYSFKSFILKFSSPNFSVVT